MMNRNPRDTYLAASVSTASPAQLLVMLYERLSLDLHRAVEAMDGGDAGESRQRLLHAQEIVLELRSALKVDDWEGGPGLAALYDYLLTELVTANVNQDRDLAWACLGTVDDLRDVWREAALSLVSASA